MRGSRSRTRVRWVVASLGTLAALATIPTGASSHPGANHPGQSEHGGPTVVVNSPAALAGSHDGLQWGDTGKIDGQTAELVYAGTGCSPANYAGIAAQIQGKIALVDDRVGTADTDQCPNYTFAQKVQSAEQAGAIGFVQIPREGDVPSENVTAVTAEIPAIEIERTDGSLAVRQAVIDGTAVEVTMTPPPVPPGMSDVECTDGMAGPFECDGIDLLSFTPQEDFNGAGVSDLWGWTDPENGDEYVILGKTNGVAFFRVTNPTDPDYLGELPNAALSHQIWHDMKVYENHAFIVSESEPHGMTVFDLTRLRGVTEPRQWDRDAFYPLHSAAHNIAINEETGFAYIVGGNAGGVLTDQCLSGLHMVDISTPKQPVLAGCYLEEGGPGTAARTVAGEVGGEEGDTIMENSPAAYVHDTECVVYDGPDTRYTGREICFNAAEDGVVIADVTNKLMPVTVGVMSYDKVSYAHQGSLTEDKRYMLLNDELDEQTHGLNTRTVVLDVSDLQNPEVHFEHLHDTKSIDHNNYVHEGRAYQSNYTSGLRVLDLAHIGDAVDPRLEQEAFFDTFPTHSDPTFDGTWSNYPYFESGTVAVSGIGEGLFLVSLTERGVEVDCGNCPVGIRAGESGTAGLTIRNTGNVNDAYGLKVHDVQPGISATVAPEQVSVPEGTGRSAAVTIQVPKNTQAGTYTLKVTATSVEDPEVSATRTVQVEVRKGQPTSLLGL